MQVAMEESALAEKEAGVVPSGDYTNILKFLGIDYKSAEYYIKVGEIAKPHGWVLHISVVLSQVGDLMQRLIPFLATEGIAFKIAMNESASEDLLSGNLGIAQIGKIVAIYPENDDAALMLAKKLIELTKSFKGPAVPTDICLGSVVYTRYESFKPIIKADHNGQEEKYFYTKDGQLIKDSDSIPFSMPAGVIWPFKELTDPAGNTAPIFFNRLYKIIDILKNDPRGNVFKGLYLKSLFQVKKCVLKQGFSNSNSDKSGRDIQDRLNWQYELYKKLSDDVPMPKIYGLIHEPSYTMLAMEFISGVSLYQKAMDVNPLSQSWQNISIRTSLKLINYGIQITLTIDKMHKRGYVHRDIIPVNFLIDKKDRIKLIDMELAYSLGDQQPDPPFTLGTSGFMSPEQEAAQKPTIAQDIYSLGATLLCLFTGLTPVKFYTRNASSLATKLEFFIGNYEVAQILANCLQRDPSSRPPISSIVTGLSSFATQTKALIGRNSKYQAKQLSNIELKGLLSAGVIGLGRAPVISANGLWYSKKITAPNYSGLINKEYTKYPGLGEGMAGPLYLLARLKTLGIDIDACKVRYDDSWRFIEETYLTSISELAPGLYNGAAGLALTLAEGIHSGMLENTSDNREKIRLCLELDSTELSVAAGTSGRGIAVMQCAQLLSAEHSKAILNKIVDDLLIKKKNDGSWLMPLPKKNRETKQTNDLGFDDAGLLWFLMDYVLVYPNNEIQKVLEDMLSRLLKTRDLKKNIIEHIATKQSYEQGDGGKGLILLFIKAYETLHDNKYKDFAVSALLKYPPCIVNNNFTQQNGLAGIGELYLEALRVFKEDQWKSRADWIAGVFNNTVCRREDGSGYWMLEERNNPTADLLTGMSGILHFLARCIDPLKIGFRILK